jgi:hypothetical protein
MRRINISNLLIFPRQVMKRQKKKGTPSREKRKKSTIPLLEGRMSRNNHYKNLLHNIKEAIKEEEESDVAILLLLLPLQPLHGRLR